MIGAAQTSDVARPSSRSARARRWHDKRTSSWNVWLLLWLLGYAAALGVLSVAAFNGWYKTTIVLAAAVPRQALSIHRLLGDRPDQRLSAWQMLVLAAAVEIGFGLCVAVGGRCSRLWVSSDSRSSVSALLVARPRSVDRGCSAARRPDLLLATWSPASCWPSGSVLAAGRCCSPVPCSSCPPSASAPRRR